MGSPLPAVSVPSPDKRIALALADLAQAYLAKVEELEAAEARRRTEAAMRYVAVPEAAAALGTSRRTIINWCQAGTLEAERHGRRWRISVTEIERMCQEGRRRGRIKAA